ncbi:hypothetical protein LCD25_14390 [Staphylococcus aureus]|nr:hypothetical protein [Staphylococcus aureus]MCE3395802.1 hypothetical protein [Staphylococcus aureus]
MKKIIILNKNLYFYGKKKKFNKKKKTGHKKKFLLKTQNKIKPIQPNH